MQRQGVDLAPNFPRLNFMALPPNWHKEDGFEFALFPAKTGKAEHLIVILHGIGGNGKEWEKAAAQLQAKVPNADIIAVQAPLPYSNKNLPDGHEGYAWFQYGGAPHKQAKAWFSHVFNHIPVVDKVNDFIDAQLKKRGLTTNDLGLIGQSMGGLVAMQAGFYRDKPCAGIVAHGGTVMPLTKIRSKPEVLLIMGDKDPIFYPPKTKPKGFLKRIFALAAKPFSLHHDATVERLKSKGVPFTEKFIPGLEHCISDESWEAGNDFITKQLQKKNNPKP